ncbi:MAG TPA: ribosome-associated translation inhibitor RaiA [Nitrospira sp.]|nr:ribosome-associated translation inhibitor RaiA [Nitrospira sp.]
MKLRITGRHMDVTPALRRYLETRFDRLDRYGLKVGTIQVVLSVEKLQHKAEAVCTVNGKRVQAKTSTREMYATIDALSDRIDVQFRKLKDRLVSHKPAKAARPRSVRALATELPAEPQVTVERRAVPMLALTEVHGHFSAQSESFMLFANPETGKIFLAQRSADGQVVVVEPHLEALRPRSRAGIRS